MDRTLEDVLKEARKEFIKLDKARLNLRQVEESLKRLCREYDGFVGCRGIRPESLRYSIEMRTGKKVA